MQHLPHATIDLSALEHNLACVRRLAPKMPIMAMLKANAYGHGLVDIAKRLVKNQVQALGVASLEAALLLRQVGIQTRIVLTTGFSTEAMLKTLLAKQIDVVVHAPYQLALMQAFTPTSLSGSLSVWLKVNTGMHRLGFLPKQTPEAYQTLTTLPWVKKPVVLMTHLAIADQFAHPLTQSQLTLFNQLAQQLKAPCTLANSTVILTWPKGSFKSAWVRPGNMLYGFYSFLSTDKNSYGLQPVMTLTAQIIATQSVAIGDGVGYGSDWCATKPSRVAVINIGYADGYPRAAPSGTPVLIQGQYCPLVGAVSMDMITVDISQCPNAKPGEPVILWGKGLPIKQIADAANTLPSEILCHVSPRVSFEAIN